MKLSQKSSGQKKDEKSMAICDRCGNYKLSEIACSKCGEFGNKEEIANQKIQEKAHRAGGTGGKGAMKVLYFVNGLCIAGLLAVTVWAGLAIGNDAEFQDRFAVAFLLQAICIGFILIRKVLWRKQP
jgi:ribosomal protein L32